MSKVKPILYMLGKGGISVLQRAIFSSEICQHLSNNNIISNNMPPGGGEIPGHNIGH